MREENNIPNLYNQQPLRGLEPSLDSPLDPNLGRGNMGEEYGRCGGGRSSSRQDPTEARELISRMTENSQSFGNRASELDNSLTKVFVAWLVIQMTNVPRLAPKKKETPKEEELLEMFRMVQINLPLPDAIQQVPRYAKFLKELCTNKRKTKESAMKLGIELGTLPPHLKYIFLGNNTFPVINSRKLNKKQEERLTEVLNKKKQAICWTLNDIKGISPTFCMHRIILEEGAKDKIQPQKRLNPTLKEVVMKDVLKLKDAEIIYPVPDSTWVSAIHVVPKKTRMTVVRNDKGEMVPM
ncbi:uncharacterized protein E6C27_scaffold34G002990 [Cucumis melo var. makuwa]|uniref:Retrotransposon gag protein n=1 Tax=Cucumis melo var. makuwa TaxID=1194695 RepID=A0A5A7SLG6_CUCMM|nr:uncharacterized protein E6C27_scaffold34G002990 [Cucumis melo var. makuwa]